MANITTIQGNNVYQSIYGFCDTTGSTATKTPYFYGYTEGGNYNYIHLDDMPVGTVFPIYFSYANTATSAMLIQDKYGSTLYSISQYGGSACTIDSNQSILFCKDSTTTLKIVGNNCVVLPPKLYSSTSCMMRTYVIKQLTIGDGTSIAKGGYYSDSANLNYVYGGYPLCISGWDCDSRHGTLIKAKLYVYPAGSNYTSTSINYVAFDIDYTIYNPFTTAITPTITLNILYKKIGTD